MTKFFANCIDSDESTNLRKRSLRFEIQNGKFQNIEESSSPQKGDRVFKEILFPGFYDAHLHLPQCDMTGSLGLSLLDWLKTYTFPAETAYSNEEHAKKGADVFVKMLKSYGIFGVGCYGTSHTKTAEILFNSLDESGIKGQFGLIHMDQEAIPELQIDTEKQLHFLSEKLSSKNHGLKWALTPRFLITSSDKQLKLLKQFCSKHPDIFIQTHWAENLKEIEGVKKRFGKDYLHAYEDYGLVRENTLLGHGIHFSDEELEFLKKSQATVVYCPSSNAALGSGILPKSRLKKAGVPVALGSDIGGGLSVSPFVTMRFAYGLARLGGHNFNIAELLKLATYDSAKALGIKAGRFENGFDAGYWKLVNIDQNIELHWRLQNCKSLEDEVSAILTLADARNVEI